MACATWPIRPLSPMVYGISTSHLAPPPSSRGTTSPLPPPGPSSHSKTTALPRCPRSAPIPPPQTRRHSNRLPTTFELTQDTFQSVMNAPQSPLVVIAAVTKENKEKVTDQFRDVGKKWQAGADMSFYYTTILNIGFTEQTRILLHAPLLLNALLNIATSRNWLIPTLCDASPHSPCALLPVLTDYGSHNCLGLRRRRLGSSHHTREIWRISYMCLRRRRMGGLGRLRVLTFT
jgi:hypothetical protein